MGQGSTENHSRTAKRPVLIPPRRAHLRCPPLCPPPACGWKVTRIPPALGRPFPSGGARSPPSGFWFVPPPPIPFSVTLSSRSVRTFGPVSPFRARILAACRHSASALLLESRRIGSFLFEHWWGIIKITIQASVLEGGKREKCFIGNGFMILFSSFPAAARLDEGL